QPSTINILSRLPVKTIIHCKCVCKKWLNIVLDTYFAHLQPSRSRAGFMIYRNSKEEMTGGFETGILKVSNTPYGPYLNGHAHWTLVGNDFPEKICSFDFNKETFELFPSPPYEAIKESFRGTLGVLKGCLCRCDTYDSNMTVWLMKEYGIKNSWHKELVIKYIIKPDFDMLGLEPNFLIEGFNDGTFLMENNESNLIVCCPRRKTVVYREVFGGYFNELPYRPSFHRLHNFKNERVHVF
ncbi:F-box protein At3g07870-like, partial [Lactuca sativa]|uniref:F-box protein At3g07870-like n=1 Tax=Lactuca sativa TaxID=4236 RepID=UPI000CD85CBF